MTTRTEPQAGLDSRVTDPFTSEPVAEHRFIRGWFTVVRSASTTGVDLVTRIPGYLTETTPHPTQDAALRAARRTYAQYRDDVRALADSDRSELQED